jgi:hypothetical protein
MSWRKKVMWLAGVVVLVELAALGCHWWWQPAPLPLAGMLGKEPVRYWKGDLRLDYAKVKESKCRNPRMPEQVVYEAFVAINNNDWERFKHLTVGREEACKDMKITEDELRKNMMCLGSLASKGSGISLSHIVQHQDDWFAIVVFDPKGWKSMAPLSLTRKYGVWRIDLSDLDHKQDPFARQALNDRALLEKLN